MQKPRFRQAFGAFLVVATGFGASVAQAAYVLTDFFRPGAATTALWDVNNTGLMVGYTTSGSGPLDVSTGFLFDGSGFTTLAGPAGAVSSFASGVSDAGVVVGSFTSTRITNEQGDVVPGPSSSFIYTAGSYVRFDVAGATETYLRAISPDGRYMSGYYINAAGRGVGFIYDRTTGVRTDVSKANSLLTIAQGINNNGLMVGSDILTGPPTTRPGFVYDVASNLRTDLAIAGMPRTAIRSIADDGEMAGWFIDAGGLQHGFVGLTTGYEQIDFLGAGATYVEGSNNAGVLVGGYTVGENTRAFIAMRVPEPGTWVLAGVALLALGVSRRRKVLAA
jgi:uncharacterized membrane protein